MRFKAILVGAQVKPFGKGVPGPWGTFCQTRGEAEMLGRGVLATLTPEDRKTAYVRVMELTEVLQCEIHVASEQGPDGALVFAYARHEGARKVVGTGTGAGVAGPGAGA